MQQDKLIRIGESVDMILSKVGTFARYPAWSLGTISERVRRRVYRSKAFQSGRHQFQPILPAIERPIFIVGTIRSGSTILAQCLARHPGIMYLGYELTTEWCDLAEIEIARSLNNMGACPPSDAGTAATGTRCQRARNGFAEIRARSGGSKHCRFLDKNPHLWNKLPLVRTIFPDASLIITSRDIRSTVASIKVLWERQNKAVGKSYYVPENPGYCWGVIPPASPGASEARRIFPGGDVAVLADYWLRVYEMIGKMIGGFEAPVLVKHRKFVADPHRTLATVYESLKLSSPRCPLPVLDTSRNDRWREILTSQEQKAVDAFIESNHSRIERLQYADTTL